MRFVKLMDAADAQIQACGIWVQVRGTIFGLFPGWWWNRSDPRKRSGVPIWMFGIKLWASDCSGGTHTAFAIETYRHRVSFRRAMCDVWSEGLEPGWHFWRRRPRPARAVVVDTDVRAAPIE